MALTKLTNISLPAFQRDDLKAWVLEDRDAWWLVCAYIRGGANLSHSNMSILNVYARKSLRKTTQKQESTPSYLTWLQIHLHICSAILVRSEFKTTGRSGCILPDIISMQSWLLLLMSLLSGWSLGCCGASVRTVQLVSSSGGSTHANVFRRAWVVSALSNSILARATWAASTISSEVSLALIVDNDLCFVGVV